MDNNTVFNVRNRSAGVVGYSIPEERIRREFAPGETKKISWYELDKLSYQPGGVRLMEEYLLIYNEEAIKELNLRTEPEYFMTEADVINMLQNGSVDELKDALDFAPTGVVQIIKDQAVALPIYDMRKRQAILEMTGFDVTSAITNSEPDPDEVVEAPAATRRVQREEAPETPVAPARRTAPKYKVIEE